MSSHIGVQQKSKVSPTVFGVVLVVAFVLFSLNLRGPITAIPPLVHVIHDSLGISLVVAGLLTSIPIVCFGVLSPVASYVIAKIGIHRSIIIMLVLTAIGTLLRPYTGVAGMMGGTMVIGAALAMGNILGLLIIGHYFPSRSSLMTGVFTSAFNIGGMMFSSLAVPIASVTGWQFSLASWVWLPVITLIAWLLVISWSKSSDTDQQQAVASENSIPAPSPLKNKTAWLLTMAMSAHLFVYFSLTAWMAAYMIDVTGMSSQEAGLVSGIYQAASLIGALAFPYIERRVMLEKLLVVIGILWFTIPLLMLLFPTKWGIWTLIGGTNNGMAFVTVLVLIIKRTHTVSENRRMSSMVQGIGFTIAAAGPVGLGYLHSAIGNWDAPMLVLMIIALFISLAGMIAYSGMRKKVTA